MLKEDGYYLSIFPNCLSGTLYNVETMFDTSLFISNSYSKNEGCDISFIEIEKGHTMPKYISTARVKEIIKVCKIFPISNRLFICGIGMSVDPQLSVSSLFFVEPFDLSTARNNMTNDFTMQSYSEAFYDLDFFNQHILFLARYDILMYNIATKQMELKYEHQHKTSLEGFSKIQTDRKNKRIYVSLQNALLILDETFHVISFIPEVHQMPVKCIDINPNKQNQILTTAGECNIKFWDLRLTSAPNYIITDTSYLINCASYNKIYDHMILYGTDNGSLVLYTACSISSSVLFKTTEEAPVFSDQIFHTYRFILDDSIKAVTWSYQDPWIFGAFCKNKIYLDTLPQQKRLEVM